MKISFCESAALLKKYPCIRGNHLFFSTFIFMVSFLEDYGDQLLTLK
jgi:hypothetical protein